MNQPLYANHLFLFTQFNAITLGKNFFSFNRFDLVSIIDHQ